MARNLETNEQIEVQNLLKSIANGEVPSEVIDEIVSIVGRKESVRNVLQPKEDTETDIKIKILNEPDWRKRVSLAALLISKSLE